MEIGKHAGTHCTEEREGGKVNKGISDLQGDSTVCSEAELDRSISSFGTATCTNTQTHKQKKRTKNATYVSSGIPCVRMYSKARSGEPPLQVPALEPQFNNTAHGRMSYSEAMIQGYVRKNYTLRGKVHVRPGTLSGDLDAVAQRGVLEHEVRMSNQNIAHARSESPAGSAVLGQVLSSA